MPESTKKAKLGGLASNWAESSAKPVNVNQVTDSEVFTTQHGGFSDETKDDQKMDRNALRGNGAASRRTALVSPTSIPFSIIVLIFYQASVTIYPSQPITLTPRISRKVSSSSEATVTKKQTEKSKLKDLPSFYHTNALWTTTFLPAFIKLLGENESPWNPTFNTVDVIQQLRDDIYLESTHTIDKKSAVYRLVSVYNSLLFTTLNPS